MMLTAMSALVARSLRDHPNQARAALHCPGDIGDIRHLPRSDFLFLNSILDPRNRGQSPHDSDLAAGEPFALDGGGERQARKQIGGLACAPEAAKMVGFVETIVEIRRLISEIFPPPGGVGSG
jgi:hypothetical protein